jgi:hypothetical protein
MTDTPEVIGTPENPLRILVADNWGADAHPVLKSKFPNCSFFVYTTVPSDHPHGHMVSECILDMLPPDLHVHLTYYPYLLLQGEDSDGWVHAIRDAREAGTPYHLANCSFGIDDFDDPRLAAQLKAEWKNGEKLEHYKTCIGDTIVVFAAGNSDRSRRGAPEMDNDVAYPQVPLSALPNVFVIGACNNRGIPSLFSSDGEEVFSMYWGEGVPVLDPLKGVNTYVDGTSFAAPFACGDMAGILVSRGSFTKTKYLKYILEKGWTAEDWHRGDHHRKAGYGCMLGVQRKRMRRPKVTRIVAPATVATVKATYLDFKPIT